MASVAPHIRLLADILLAAATADARNSETKRRYAYELVLELLCATELPAELETKMAAFDPLKFSLSEWAANFREVQPMRPKRVIELISYVTLADGDLAPVEAAFIRATAVALGMQRDEYAHLLPADMPGPSDSFVDLAPVPLPPVRRE